MFNKILSIMFMAFACIYLFFVHQDMPNELGMNIVKAVSGMYLSLYFIGHADDKK